MKKKTIIITLSIFLLFFGFCSFVVYLLVINDPIREQYKDRVEYPLKTVDINDDSEYILVKIQYSPDEKYEIITDTQTIKANVSSFSVDNIGSIYGTTPDGEIKLYKDGEQIDQVVFDSLLTRTIEYGTLQFQQINELQYLLKLGYDIIEQGENYSIIGEISSEKTYYWFFAHGKDLEDIETVYFLDFDSDLDKLPRPRKISEDIIEFYGGTYWYFRLSDNQLSNPYWNVKAVKDNLIVYASDHKGSIIIHDMFDKAAGYKEITGFLPKPREDDFLLAAEFTAEGTLSVDYFSQDGQRHEEVFSLE